MSRLEAVAGILLGLALVAASVRGWIPYSLIETLAFVSGAGCVWLVVREHILNFPIGIASCLFLLILCIQTRLYGDAGLQVIFIVLGAHGWHQWLHGGERKTALRVARAPRKVLALAGGLVLAGTAGLTLVLRVAKGSAPVLDAFTTVLSLAAQVLLNRKYLENWYLWIVADVFYIYLYTVRGLQLTAVLYGIFLCLCLAGLAAWRRALREGEPVTVERGSGPAPAAEVGDA